MHLVNLAGREAWGLRRRYLGLVVLVALSVAFVGAGLLVTTGAERALRSDIAESTAQRSVVVTSDFSSSNGQVLDVAHVERLGALPGVTKVEPTLDVPVSTTVTGTLVVFSISSLRTTFLPPIVRSAGPEVTALAGDEVLLPLTVDGVSLEPVLGRTVSISHDEFVSPGVSRPVQTDMRVVGLTDPAWQQDTPTPAYAAAATVEKWFDEAAADGVAKEVAVQGYQEATVLVTTAGQVRTVLKAAQGMGLSATATQDLTPQLPDQLQVVKTLTTVVLVVLILLAAVSSSFLIRSLVLQRTREIGLLKSLGYRNRQVWGVMMMETMMVSWAGSATGLVLATVTANVGKQFVPSVAVPHLFNGVLLPRPGLILGSLLLAMVVVLAGSALPLTRAFRLAPAEALRDTL